MNARHRKTATNDGSRLAGLEGTRGLLALGVLLAHSAALLSPQTLADTKLGLLAQAIVFFFVLSGFFIYMPFVGRLLDGRTLPGIGNYFRSRTLRIFPAYLVAFLVANFVFKAVFMENASVVSEPRTDHGTGSLIEPGTVLLHLSLLQNYLPGELQTGLNPAWTLTVELAFYIALPIVMVAAFAVRDRTRSSARRLAFAVPAIFIAVGVISRFVAGRWSQSLGMGPLEAEWGANWIAVLSRSFLVWADNFGFGMLAATVFVLAKRRAGYFRWAEALTSVATLRRWTLLIFLGALAVSAAAFLMQSRYLATALAVASAAVILVLVLPAVEKRTSSVSRAIDARPLHYLGTISLGIYLWHYPVLLLFVRTGLFGPDNAAGMIINFIWVAVPTIILAALSYHFVELPALRLRRKPELAEAATAPQVKVRSLD